MKYFEAKRWEITEFVETQHIHPSPLPTTRKRWRQSVQIEGIGAARRLVRCQHLKLQFLSPWWDACPSRILYNVVRYHIVDTPLYSWVERGNLTVKCHPKTQHRHPCQACEVPYTDLTSVCYCVNTQHDVPQCFFNLTYILAICLVWDENNDECVPWIFVFTGLY